VLFLGLGLALRLVWVAVHPVAVTSDFSHYNALAETLARHGVYGEDPRFPAAYWPPGWPALLGLLYSVAGVHPRLGAVLGATLDWAAIVVASVAAVRLLRPRFAVGAVAAMCLYPAAISLDPVLATEHLTALLFTSVVVLMAFSRPSLRTGLAVGLLEGALLLTRADYGVPTALVIAVWLSRGLPVRRLAPVAAVTALAALALMSPWIARNFARFDEFIPTSTNGGINFYLGTVAARYTVPPFVLRFHVSDQNHPKAHENTYYRHGFDNLAHHPLRWLGYDTARFYLAYGREWNVLDWGDIDAPVVRGAATAYWLALCALGLLGLAAIGVDRRLLPRAWLVIAGSLAAVTILKLFYIDTARTRVPLTYLLIVVAGLGAQRLSDAYAERRRRAASSRSGRGPRTTPAS
jgi:hypothetical protein